MTTQNHPSTPDPLVGCRIELLAMPDDPDPVPIGSTGTITRVQPISLGPNRERRFTQIEVDWDNGRSLSMTVPPDRYRVLEKEAAT